MRVWQRTASYEILPGMVLLLKAAAGGYEPFSGLDRQAGEGRHKVPQVETQTQSDNEGMEEGHQVRPPDGSPLPDTPRMWQRCARGFWQPWKCRRNFTSR